MSQTPETDIIVTRHRGERFRLVANLVQLARRLETERNKAFAERSNALQLAEWHKRNGQEALRRWRQAEGMEE
jgi:hypothetical protein